MKNLILFILANLFAINLSFAQDKETKDELMNLSNKKWEWMAQKDIYKLDGLFDDKSIFVHMGGFMNKTQELAVIKSGGIWYKKADVHEVTVNVINNTAILISRIDLLAVVGGNEVTNPFLVTEVYINEGKQWKIGSLSFTKLLTKN